MAVRDPLVLGDDGLQQALQRSDQLRGRWAKRIPIPAAAAGAFSTTIPAGIFAAMPAFGHTIETAGANPGTRDYVLRLATPVLNADKTLSVSGLIRQSRLLPGTLLVSGGNETFEAVTVALTLNLTADEVTP